MLPKAHLTSHSRMLGSRWVTTLSWLSKTFFFFYSSSAYSCHLFLISFASVRSFLFLSYIVPMVAWNVPLVFPIFLKSLKIFPFYCIPPFLCTAHIRRLSYLHLLFSGTLHSVGISFPFSFLFSSFSQLSVRPRQTPLCLLAFLFLWDGFGHSLLYNVVNLHL